MPFRDFSLSEVLAFAIAAVVAVVMIGSQINRDHDEEDFPIELVQ